MMTVSLERDHDLSHPPGATSDLPLCELSALRTVTVIGQDCCLPFSSLFLMYEFQ